MGGLTIGYCFPYCFLEIFVGGQDLDGGDNVLMGGSLTMETLHMYLSPHGRIYDRIG